MKITNQCKQRQNEAEIEAEKKKRKAEIQKERQREDVLPSQKIIPNSMKNRQIK